MLRPVNSVMSAIAAAFLLGGCGGQPQVSFKTDVQPLLQEYCASCHVGGGEGATASGFQVGSYEAVMKGTKYGPVVVAGDPLSSSLYRLVAGKVDPSIQMPHGEKALAAEEVATIEAWIEQGAENN